MKTVRLYGLCYVVLGLVGASILLAACSSGGGAEPLKVNTPTPERVPVVNTPTPEQRTVISTPTPEQGMVVSTPTPTPARQASPSPAAVTEAEIREIRMTIKDNTFPKEIRVKVGERVVFVVTNEGPEKHSFELPDFNVYQEIRAGETGRIEWVVPDKKGKWDVGCYLTQPDGPHDGMEGVLIIE